LRSVLKQLDEALVNRARASANLAPRSEPMPLRRTHELKGAAVRGNANPGGARAQKKTGG
jgi:hypothetical protein